MVTKDQPTTADWNERPVFGLDQKLTPERLNRIHEYHAARMRHLLTGLAGPGVVHGYAIATEKKGDCVVKSDRLYIGCGLAIDWWGRQLYWPGGWICMDDLVGFKPTADGRYTFSVHYAERRVSGDRICGCEGHETEWIEEGVVFSLTPGCKPIDRSCPDHCGKCVNLREYVCGRTGAERVVIPKDQWLDKMCEPVPEPCAVGPDKWLYDETAGLPLACVQVCDLPDGKGDCGPRYGFVPDGVYACDFRPYVYRNPLLFELIRGCHLDLARVKKLSFSDQIEDTWSTPLQWEVFTDMINGGLAVWFTKPIEKSALTPASVFVTAIVSERDSYFNDVLRLPVAHMQFLEDQGKYAGGVKLEFLEVWRTNQFHEDRSRFDHGAIIEFTVRGCMLRDECGCMLDGRPLDISPDKPGQAMPGDDFVVAFCVASKPAGGSRIHREAAPPAESAPSHTKPDDPTTAEWSQP